MAFAVAVESLVIGPFRFDDGVFAGLFIDLIVCWRQRIINLMLLLMVLYVGGNYKILTLQLRLRQNVCRFLQHNGKRLKVNACDSGKDK